MKRILWNRRPTSPADTGDIDEIVVNDAMVHVEQMHDRCWWIGVYLPDGTSFAGNFTADSRGRMRFGLQECDIAWDRDETHKEGT